MHKNKTIIRNYNLCDDLLRWDTQLKVVHTLDHILKLHAICDFRDCSFLGGAVQQILELFRNLWDIDQLAAPVPLFGELFHIFGTLLHNFWNCSTKSGTVPLCVGLLPEIIIGYDHSRYSLQRESHVRDNHIQLIFETIYLFLLL